MGAGVRAVCAAAPSARAPASRPTGGCRLPGVSVYTHAHTGVHAPPPDTCSSRTCGRTPLSASSRSQSPSLSAGLPLPHSERGPPAWQLRDPAQLPQVPHPVSGPLLGLSHSWPRCPTDLCPPAGIPAAATYCCASALRRPLSIHFSPLSLYRVGPQLALSLLLFPSFSRSPLLRRSVTFETWNSRGNLKRASCP